LVVKLLRTGRSRLHALRCRVAVQHGLWGVERSTRTWRNSFWSGSRFLQRSKISCAAVQSEDQHLSDRQTLQGVPTSKHDGGSAGCSRRICASNEVGELPACRTWTFLSLKEVDPSSFDSCDGGRPNGQIIEQTVADAAGTKSPAANFRAEGLHVRHAADHNPTQRAVSRQCWQTAGITSDPSAILPSRGCLSEREHDKHYAWPRYAHNTICALATSHRRLLRSTMHYRGNQRLELGWGRSGGHETQRRWIKGSLRARDRVICCTA